MQLTDTHTHLYSGALEENAQTLIQQAIDKGIERFFMPNVDLESIDGMLKIHDFFPKNTFCTLGLHPTSVTENYIETLEKIEKRISDMPIVAIGEIGIDLFWDKSLLKEQQEAFRRQIRLAKDLNLPIIIHARESFPEIFEILDEENDSNLRGIFHCFTGNEAEVNKILSFKGFKMGIGGVFTFKKSHLPELLKSYSLTHFVLETDAPYLAPHPYRGKLNLPEYLYFVAEKMADTFHISVEKLAEITTENSKEVFKV